MEESFELPVTHKGAQLHFPAKLIHYGYGYKIQVTVNGQEILFERDEEGNFRALVPYDQLKDYKQEYISLLKAITNAIDSI